jgi:cytochrome P450
MVPEPAYYPMASENPLDPPPELVRVQRECPVTRVRTWDEKQPWLVTGFDNVRALLSDPRVSAVDSHPAFPHVSRATEYTRVEFPTFLQMDAPEHGFYRLMVAGDFSVSKSESRRAEILATVDAAIDELLRLEPPVNFVEQFAMVVPSTMIAMMLGVPQTDHALFQRLTHTMTSGRSTAAELKLAMQEMRDYLDALVTSKEQSPQDDLLSRVVVKYERTDQISHELLVATARMLLAAGHDTTASMISLGMLILLLNPAERNQLDEDRSLIPNAVEEMLRYFSITHLGRRRVLKEDVVIAGVTLAAGEGVIVDTKIANRDERIFPNPDVFDIDRVAKGHVAFGMGPHQCLGQQLARVELQVVFDRLLTRIPTLRLASDPDAVVWRDPQNVIFGLQKLFVAW